jgi:hypothetical protein
MIELADIQLAVSQGKYKYTLHAVQRTTERHISRVELEEVIAKAEIIEEYPQDKYGPSCLLYGETLSGRVLHIQISLPPLVKIITAYEPDTAEWIDYKVRKPQP